MYKNYKNYCLTQSVTNTVQKCTIFSKETQTKIMQTKCFIITEPRNKSFKIFKILWSVETFKTIGNHCKIEPSKIQSLKFERQSWNLKFEDRKLEIFAAFVCDVDVENFWRFK